MRACLRGPGQHVSGGNSHTGSDVMCSGMVAASSKVHVLIAVDAPRFPRSFHVR